MKKYLLFFMCGFVVCAIMLVPLYLGCSLFQFIFISIPASLSIGLGGIRIILLWIDWREQIQSKKHIREGIPTGMFFPEVDVKRRGQ